MALTATVMRYSEMASITLRLDFSFIGSFEQEADYFAAALLMPELAFR
jgi:Zn-dependent peptidase ImmA (M78 family)